MSTNEQIPTDEEARRFVDRSLENARRRLLGALEIHKHAAEEAGSVLALHQGRARQAQRELDELDAAIAARAERLKAQDRG